MASVLLHLPQKLRSLLKAATDHQKHKEDGLSMKSHPLVFLMEMLTAIKQFANYLSTSVILLRSLLAWQMAIAAASAASSGLGTAGRRSNWHTI
jgi:hypothetical protein